MSQPSLFRPRQFPAETLAISAVAWSTDGAPSRTSKALATLGDSGSILVRRLPQPEAVPALDGEGERTVRYRVINGNGRLEDLHALGETHVVAKVAPRGLHRPRGGGAHALAPGQPSAEPLTRSPSDPSPPGRRDRCRHPR